MANLLQVTPWLLTKDVHAMVRFFVEVLGFHAWTQDEFYAYVSRDDAAVRIGKLPSRAKRVRSGGLGRGCFTWTSGMSTRW